MPIYEFIVFIIFLLIFMGGFLYCFFKETKSSSDLRKRLIKHIDSTEALYYAWVSDLTARANGSERT